MKTVRQEFLESVIHADSATLVRRYVHAKRRMLRPRPHGYGSLAVRFQYLQIMREEILRRIRLTHTG